MRVILFTVLFTAASILSAKAQEHQFSVGVGGLSTNSFADILINVAKSVVGDMVGSDAKLENQRAVGEFRVGYAYYPIERVSVGATASFLQTTSDAVSEGSVTGDYSSTYLTFAAEGTYTYLTRNNIRLYGLLGAGLTNLNSKYTTGGESQRESDPTNYFNFHVSPIGITFGKQFGGTAEVGFGYRGIISLGLYYRL